MTTTINHDSIDEVAIVGFAGRFPGAKNVQEFWQNLKNGVESITFFSDEELLEAGADPQQLASENLVKSRPMLEGIDLFDADFFGYPPKVAAFIDPQQRVFLECVWEALEAAGYDPASYDGRIGIYAGASFDTYLLRNAFPSTRNGGVEEELQLEIGNDKDYLTNRVAYKLNLTGPAITVQTACSTSLVAVHLACQSLYAGDSDMVLAGGVAVRSPEISASPYEEGGLISPDGHCRPFDADARGTVFGSGAGIVVLKRLADALADGDTVYAVVKGSAVNNDGAAKIGYTAPSFDGQVRVITEALEDAGVEAESIGYVEAHGTGTTLGDPIEVQALSKAYAARTGRKGTCAIGSVKGNIGHLATAAGVAGLIKTVLSLKHQLLPPALNYQQPNPKLELDEGPFYVNAELSCWEANGTARRASVSSFGVGGTNAHVVLEEAPEPEPSSAPWPWQLFVLSARNAAALDSMTSNLVEHLNSNPAENLADVAHTLQVGRKAFDHRRMVVCQDTKDAVSALDTMDPARVVDGVREFERRSIVFMFPGQGAQHLQMAAGLYRHTPLFREQVDRCCELVKPHLQLDLRDLIFADTNDQQATKRLNQTDLTQVALFVIEYALAKCWMQFGVQPVAMIGHSIGEYVAGCLAGVFSLEDALSLVAIRGRLMVQCPAGSMLSVSSSADEIRPLLSEQVSVAAINTPSRCVISGPIEHIETVRRVLEQRGVTCQDLHTSHAFHSCMMEPVVQAFTEELKKLRLSPPKIPVVSNLTGTWITATEATDPNYWAQHLRQTVRFADGIEEIVKQENVVLLEVGPGSTLSTLARQHPAKPHGIIAIPSLPHPKENREDLEVLLRALGQLWLAGVRLDWAAMRTNEKRRRIPLPTYPFQRQRYWIDSRPTPPASSALDTTRSLQGPNEIADWFYVPSWSQSVPLAPFDEYVTEDLDQNWLVFVDEAGQGLRLVERLRQLGRNVISVEPAERFQQSGENAFCIRPHHPEDFDALFDQLGQLDVPPTSIVHLWSLNTQHGVETASAELDRTQDLGFYSMLFLAQAIGKQAAKDEKTIWVVADGALAVTGHEVLQPQKATILGPCKIMPREYPNITCRFIDVDGSQSQSQNSPQWIEQLLSETSSETDDAIVAYRGRHRWTLSYELLRLDEVNEERRLRKRGVYVITGGLGGIGNEVSRHFARAAGARLVLVGRTQLPDRSKWDGWLQTHENGDTVSQKIRQIQALEELGAEVLPTYADVANRDEMREVVTLARDRFGTIDGVVHAAGIPGGGVIQLKTREMADRVMKPKVHGTLALAEALKDEDLDFFVLCSSTLSIASRFGQVDYCAANAFLDAFAHAHNASTASNILSINWDGWTEVGMAARAGIFGDGNSSVTAPHARDLDHPLLERCILETADQRIYATTFSADKHWVLSEHRVADSPLIPGTTYLEMASAAFSDFTGREQLEIRDAIFIAPLSVKEGDSQEVHAILQKDADRYRFAVVSALPGDNGGARRWREHMRATLVPLTSATSSCEVADIVQRCKLKAAHAAEKASKDAEASFVDWGPRWDSEKHTYVGSDETLTFLELPNEFADDLEQYRLHPALLDVAGGAPLSAFVEGRFLPWSYQSLKLHKPLVKKTSCHVTCRPGTSREAETISYDLAIRDVQGETLVEVGNVIFKRVNDATLSRQIDRSPEESSAAKSTISASDASYYERHIPKPRRESSKQTGISPQQGVDALNRILARGITPQVVVSVQDLPSMLKREDPFARAEEALAEQAQPETSHRRPDLKTSFAAPSTEAEEQLAEIWQGALGIDQIGIHDNFFELGGDSLIAIKVIAEANELGLGLSPDLIFEQQTIAKLASCASSNADLATTASSPQPMLDPLEANDAPVQPTIDDSGEFGWTAEDLDDIAAALKKTVNNDKP